MLELDSCDELNRLGRRLVDWIESYQSGLMSVDNAQGVLKPRPSEPSTLNHELSAEEGVFLDDHPDRCDHLVLLEFRYQ